MNYDERISWLAGNLEHPRFKAKIKETAEKFQSSEKDVRTAIYAKSPVSAHAAGLNGAGVDGLPQCVFDMINKFEVTDEEVADIEDPYFMYLDVISEGKLIAIVGLPSAGKTTIMEFICSKIDKTILYINSDISKPRTSRWTNLRTSRWTNPRMSRWTNLRTSRWTSPWKNRSTK